MTSEVMAFAGTRRDYAAMQRRHFIQLSTGAALGAYVGRSRVLAADAPGGPINASTFHAMRRFADTRYGRIAYVERGSGKAALFLHGFLLNGFQWRGAIERLSPYRQCVAPDLMGLGYSEIPEGQSLAPLDQVGMLAALLDTLHIPDVDLIANDSGGGIAQLFVARYPHRVRTLLLTNCEVVIDSPPPSLLPVIAMARKGTFADEIIVPQLNPTFARSPKGIGPLLYQDPAHPTDEAIQCYFTPLVSSPRREAQVGAYAIALEKDALLGIEPALHRFNAPVRIVWGTADTIFSPACPDWLDHAFPRSRGVRRVEGAKLFFPEEQPDLLATEARALWGG